MYHIQLTFVLFTPKLFKHKHNMKVWGRGETEFGEITFWLYFDLYAHYDTVLQSKKDYFIAHLRTTLRWRADQPTFDVLGSSSRVARIS